MSAGFRRGLLPQSEALLRRFWEGGSVSNWFKMGDEESPIELEVELEKSKNAMRIPCRIEV